MQLGKANAEKILSQDIDTPELLILSLKWQLCQYIGIGLYDTYFEDRDLVELVTELELYKGRGITAVEKGTSLLTKAKQDDLDDLVADMPDDSDDDWNEVKAPDPTDADMEMYKEFMNTGNFVPDKQIKE